MEEKPFWDAQKSTTLSIVVAWIALALAVACLPMLVPILKMIRDADDWMMVSREFVERAVIPFYVCLGCGIVALIILLRLLGAIRRGDVFTTGNVRRLRLISYCGFAIMMACVVGAVLTWLSPVFIFLAIVAGFLGLLMRVIKNVIDAARLLKEESDYTI